MTRMLNVIAVGLIVLGSVAMAGPTFGFSTIAGDRAVSVSTADDPAALLGLDIASNVSPGDQTELVDITNNFDNQMDVTIVLGEDAVAEGFSLRVDGENEGAQYTFQLRQESNKSIEIDIPNGNSNVDSVSFDIVAEGPSGNSVTLSRDNTTVQDPGNSGGGDDSDPGKSCENGNAPWC